MLICIRLLISREDKNKIPFNFKEQIELVPKNSLLKLLLTCREPVVLLLGNNSHLENT